MKTKFMYITIVVVLLTLVACGQDNPAERRESRMSKNDPEIAIAIVWPWSGTWENFGKGATLAAEQINKNKGPLDKKIVLSLFNDKNSEKEALSISRKIITNPHFVAVIGHPDSYIALACAPNYRWGDLIFLTPSTLTRLTADNKPFVFRLNANEYQLENKMVSYISNQNIKNILMYYQNDEDSRDAANQFEKIAARVGIDIIDRRNFENENSMRYLQILKDWKNLYEFDALIIIGNITNASVMIKTIRQLGITQPIIGSSSLLFPKLFSIAGKGLSNVFIASINRTQNNNQQYLNFTKAYVDKHHEQPDTPAMLGYDSVYILTNAIKKGQSLHWNKIVQALQHIPGYQGVFTTYNFTREGDLVNPPISVWQTEQGKFKSIQPLE